MWNNMLSRVPVGGSRNSVGGALGVQSIVGPGNPVIGVGLNHKDNAAESHMPIPKDPPLFLNPLSAIIGPQGVKTPQTWTGTFGLRKTRKRSMAVTRNKSAASGEVAVCR
jgi:2-keto-4-pentenoate hydratase/2-oxohepta-3-ene-1,7-dioic acid hydratase in catechol pathway